MQITKTLFNTSISDLVKDDKVIDKEHAEQLFIFFKNCSLFRWKDANNDCEDRANALCLLLDEWNVPNYKAWVFSGYVFKKAGFLINLWKYHVAAAIPVKEANDVKIFVIDPATSPLLLNVEDWASNVTDNPHSFYSIKNSEYYIFNQRKIEKDNWYRRNKRNYNWTIQGLSGINGLSSKGKAQLRFNKRKVVKTGQLFNELKKAKLSFV